MINNSCECYKKMFDVIEEMLCCLDNEQNILFYNDAFKNTFSFSNNEVGLNILEVLDECDVSEQKVESIKIIRKILSEDHEVNEWIELPEEHMKLVYVIDNNIQKSMIIIKSFDHYISLQEELEDYKIKYTQLNKASEVASAVLNPSKMKFTACNDHMLYLFGLTSREELEDITVENVSPKYQADGQLSSVKSVEMMGKAIEKGSHDFDWLHKSRQGHEFSARVHLSVFGANKDIMFCIFKQSPEEQRKLENEVRRTLEEMVDEKTKELNDALECLETAQQMLINVSNAEAINNIIVGIAHELGTPLGACLTTASYLKKLFGAMDDISAVEKKEYIESNSNQLTEVIDIMNSSILTAVKKFEIIRETLLLKGVKGNRKIQVHSFLSNMINNQFSKRLAIDKNVELNIPDGLVIYSNKIILQSIFTHLIENSLDHSGKSKSELKVIIRVQSEDDYINLFYYDNGVGVSESVKSKIFQPFTTTKRSVGKMGIGLTLVNNLVSELNGILELKDVDEGFALEIRVPDMKLMKGEDNEIRT